MLWMIGEADFVKVEDVIGRDDLRTWFLTSKIVVVKKEKLNVLFFYFLCDFITCRGNVSKACIFAHK